MGPSESYLPRSIAEGAKKKQKMADIMEEGLPPPPSNSTHFYIGNEDENDIVE